MHTVIPEHCVLAIVTVRVPMVYIVVFRLLKYSVKQKKCKVIYSSMTIEAHLVQPTQPHIISSVIEAERAAETERRY